MAKRTRNPDRAPTTSFNRAKYSRWDAPVKRPGDGGVWLDEKRGVWVSAFKQGESLHELGTYPTRKEAIKSYMDWFNEEQASIRAVALVEIERQEAIRIREREERLARIETFRQEKKS